MNISVLAFLVGPLAGPVLAAGSCVAILATTRRPRVVFPAAVMALVEMASFVTYWYFWGPAFDAVDAGREMPAGVESAEDISTAVCAASATLLAALAVGVLASRRGRRNIVGAPSGAI